MDPAKLAIGFAALAVLLIFALPSPPPTTTAPDEFGAIRVLSEAEGMTPAKVLEAGKPAIDPTPTMPAVPFNNAVVDVLLDEEGRVMAVKLLTATDPQWAVVVIDSVRQWKFSPAIVGGQPVKSWYIVRFPPPVFTD